jgi:flagellar motor switch protein FliM
MSNDTSVENELSETEAGREPVQLYDFSHPNVIPEDQLNTLSLIHQTYVDNVSLTLSSMLSSDISLEVDAVEQMTFSEYTLSILNPTCLASFDMPPLNGFGLIEVNAPIVYTVIDRMLGGSGEIPPIARSFTELEMAITQKLMKTLLSELTKAWDPILHMSFGMREMFTNPALIRAIPLREICISIRLKIKINEQAGLITLCIPYVNLEPIATKLRNEQWNNLYSTRQPLDIQQAHIQNFNAVKVPVDAVLGKLKLSLADLLILQVGDILSLDQKVRDPIQVLVSGTHKFNAVPGLSGQYNGVSIQQEINKEQ